MFQIINCECGEPSMLADRCIECKRVRPSSAEMMKRIQSLQKDTSKALEDLKVAIELELQDRE